MGGSISTDRSITIQELTKFPRCSALEYWINEDEELLHLIREYLSARFGILNPSFPTHEHHTLYGVDFSNEEIGLLRDYVEFLTSKIEYLKTLRHKEEETIDYDQCIKLLE